MDGTGEVIDGMLAAEPAHEPVKSESDFSPRKLRIAMAIITGTLFGSTVFPFVAQGLMLIPMTQEFGWSYFEFSLGLSAMMLGGMCSSPFLGRLVDRIGVRRIIIPGTAGVGLLTMAQALQSGPLWLFLLGFAVLGSLGSTAVGYAKVLGSLFNQHRGKALALFGVESSLAGALAVPIIQWLINNYGWRGAFVGMGLIILSTVPLLLAWLAEPDPPQAASLQLGEVPGVLVSQALRDRTFWIITAAGFLAIIPAIGMMPHMVPYMLARGVNLQSSIWMLSVMSIAMAAGTLVGGWLLDHAPNAKVAVPFAALSTLGLLGMLFLSGSTTGMAILAISVAVMGFAGGAKRPMATFFQLRFFGLKDFGGISGAQAPFIAGGMLLAPPAVGLVYDRLGTYEPALWAMVGLMGLTIFAYLLLGPYRFAKDLTELPQTPK